MADTFYPTNQSERYLLLVAIYHVTATRKTMTAIIGEPAAPIIRGLRKRGLTINSRGGGYEIPESDRQRVINGLLLPGV